MKILFLKSLLFCSFIVYSQNFNSESLSRLFVNASYGFSWQTASIGNTINADERKFYSDLSNGFGFEIGLGYKLRKNQYLRGFYNNFSSTANFRNLVAGETSLNYYGIGYGMIYEVNDKHEFVIETGLGYNSLYNKVSFPDEFMQQKGGNIAFNAQMSFLFGLTDKFKIGPSISFFSGTISEVDFSLNNEPYRNYKLSEDERIGMGRFNLIFMAKYDF